MSAGDQGGCMDVVIGVDTGTTATKAIAAGPRGEVRAMASVHYPLSVPGPGQAELDPVQLRDAAIEALITVAEEARERGDRVIAVSLSALDRKSTRLNSSHSSISYAV